MSVTTTPRLLLSKPDATELIAISLLNNNMDAIDSDFRPAAKMKATSDQTLTNATVTVLGYNAVDYDSYAARPEGAMVNLTTDLITIRKAGLYLVINKVAFAPNATGVRRLDLNINGSFFETHAVGAYASANNTLIMVSPLVLAVNDTLGGAAYQNSTASLAVVGTASQGVYLAAIWLGNIS